MITLDDIVNSAASKVKGTLVLHRSMAVNSTFKIYKIFTYNLYHLIGNDKKLLFSFAENRNCPVDNIEKIWEECDKVYLTKLIDWLIGNNYKELIDEIQ